MPNFRQALAQREDGHVRYSIVFGATQGMAAALQKFGLFDAPAALQELSRELATATLAVLLEQSLAYNVKLMSQEQAKLAAAAFMSEHAVASSRFFSNGKWINQQTWSPMTSCTFDAGVIIENPLGEYVCVWFEDED